MNLRVLICSVFLYIFCIIPSFAQEQTLDITVDCADQVQGMTDCITFKSGPIEQLTALQFTISYDPTVLQIIPPSASISSCLTNLGSDNFDISIPGTITFIWYQDAINITSGCDLFSLCFNYIGQPGESSVVTINSLLAEVEAVSELGNVNVNINDCLTTVLPFGRSIVTNYCNPTSMASADGTLCFYGIGGNGPYTYTVSNGMVVASGVLNDKEEFCLTNLPKGNYTITIVDDSNIVFPPKNVAMIDFNTNPTFDIDWKNPSCFYRNDGTINISNINVATIAKKIQWSNGLFNVENLSGLLAGNYTVTVIDGNGCKTTKSALLKADTLKLDIEVLAAGKCKGAKDAELKITASGGTPNPLDNSYDITLSSVFSKMPTNPYVWLNAPTGKLTMKLRDYGVNYLGNVNPCVVETMIDVPYRDTIKFTDIMISDIECKGKGKGSLQVTFGGTGTSYSIAKEWNVTANKIMMPGGGILGKTTYIHNELDAGSYYVIAKANECLDTFKWTIKEPLTPFIVNADVVQPQCGGGLGSILLKPTGGDSPYVIKWDDGDDKALKNNLLIGDYTVTVTDKNNCDTIMNFVLRTSNDPMPTAAVLKSITCNNFSDGEVIVNTVGTGSNISYLWQDISGKTFNTKIVTGLPAGKYKVTVTIDGCSGTSETELFNPPAIKIETVNLTSPECPKGGGKGSIGVTVSGGFPVYNYEWTRTGNATIIGQLSVLPNLDAGSYSVAIKDQNNCRKDTIIILNGPPDFKIDLSGLKDVSCFEKADGNAIAKASSGPVNNGRYVFFWSNGQKSTNLFDMDVNLKLSAGRNWIFVADSKCVSDTLFFDIGSPPAITTTVDIIGTCAGDCNNQINVATQGGSLQPLVVTWPTIVGQSGNSVFNLCVGSYPYVVTDGAGCVFRDTVIIGQDDTLKVSLNEELTVPLSCKVSIGQMAVDVNGGKSPYQFAWTNNISTTNIAKDLGQGTYTVTVTDANGCTNSLSYTFVKSNPIVAEIEPPSAPTCFGGKTCIKVNNVSGGVGNYSMQINNGFRIPIDSCYLLFAGNYLVSIFDGAGCKEDYPITIPQRNPIEVDLGEDLKLKLGDSIDRIEPIINNEFPIVNYSWQGLNDLICLDDNCTAIGGTPSVDHFIKLVVTDENGCTGFDELSIAVSDERNVYFPNIVNFNSTNEANKTFEIVIGVGVESVEELVIFDRWGNIVHQRFNYIPDPTTGWNGSLSGQNALPGVYVYRAKVKFIDGQAKTYFGDVTLFR